MCDRESGRDTCKVELADIFRLHGDAYRQQNVLTPEQHKVMNAIQNCRTSVLGGHVEQCDYCHTIHVSYNSCRNRHCPKCQSFKTARWLEDRRKELLPVPYFHVVFTLPHELNALVLYNKSALYSLLFKSVWETVNTLGKDPKRLNGLMGMIAILHTWGQNLTVHNHIHSIVPGGALNNQGKWKSSKKTYLFPVKVMSRIFRGIYISGLRTLYENNQLVIPNQEQHLKTKEGFDTLLDNLMKKEWVVYSKEPFAGPEKLLDYLGRYANKIAISNHRILNVDEESVTFKWRDYSDNSEMKIMKLKADEFIRRFLTHVVPKGFMRIRFSGFLANSCKTKNIETIRRRLSYAPKHSGKKEDKKDTKRLMFELTGIDITLCSACKKGHLCIIQTLPNKFSKTKIDTS